MGTPKGMRFGGRQKGTPNKKTQSLLEKCAALDFDPFNAMLEIAKDPTHEHRVAALKEVCQYLYPKRKSLEHSANVDPQILEAAENVLTMTKEEQINYLEEQLKALKGDQK